MSDQENEPRIPTKEEIAELPRWAKVAFAARCARRVYPLFELGWPEAPAKHKKAIIEAIEFAEKAAADATFAAPAAADKADVVANNAYDDNAAAYAAYAARASADAVRTAIAANTNVAADTVDDATDAADAADDVAPVTNVNYIILLISHIWLDFNELYITAISNKWTDDTPLPLTFFGPLWPDGEPNWKDILSEQDTKEVNKENKSEKGLSIQAVIPDYISAEQASVELIKLFDALSEYHIACGGNGLVIEDFQTFVKEGAFVEVGQ